MTRTALACGWQAIRRWPILTLIIYGVGVAMAFLIAIPFAVAIQDAAGSSKGLLAGSFELGLWYDTFREARGDLFTVALHLLWVVPLYLVWDAASSVGLCFALANGHGFWHGAGRFAGRSVVIGLVYLAMLIAVLAGLIAMIEAMGLLIAPGAVRFYLQAVGIPVGLVLAVLLINLMRDASRAALVVQDVGLGRALRAGLAAWPMTGAYVLWTAAALGILAVSIALESSLNAGTMGSAVILAVGLQVLMLLRAAVRVAWHGSLVALTPLPSLPAGG